MTEENHCYQNAQAERINGILKDEVYLDQTFTRVLHPKKAIKLFTFLSSLASMPPCRRRH